MINGVYICMRCRDTYSDETAVRNGFQCSRRGCGTRWVGAALWYQVRKPNGDYLYIQPEGLNPRARGIDNRRDTITKARAAS